MSSQLEQLLGYLEREGVTEVLFGSGRPIAMRKGGAITNITARPLSADQLANMLRGSEISSLVPDSDGEGRSAEITVGRRRATAQVARRGHEIVVSLTRAEDATANAAGTLPIARVATPGSAVAAPSVTPPTRAKTPTAARAKSPTRGKSATAAPRSKTPTGAKTMPRAKTKGTTVAPRNKGQTSSPRNKTGAVPKVPATPGASATPPPPVSAPMAFEQTAQFTAIDADFSLDDGIELGAPLETARTIPAGAPQAAKTIPAFGLPLDGAKTLPAVGASLDAARTIPAAPRPDHGISLGALDSESFELDLAPPQSFDVDLGTSPPQSFAAPPRAAAPSSQEFARPLANESFAKPRSEEFAKPRANEGFVKVTSGSFAKPQPISVPASIAPQPAPAEDPFSKTTPFGSATLREPYGRATTETDGAPQEIATAGTQPIQSVRHQLPSTDGAPLRNPAFAALVEAARELGASDLHIAAARVTSVRVNGELIPIEQQSNPLSAQGAEELLLPLLEPQERAILDKNGYVDLALAAPDGGRLRVNISRQQQGLKGTFRLALPAPASLEQLGLPAELAKVVAHHQGLVVIAGPSGHGKTTTLAALVDMLNSTKAYHILTIEDPVEIVHPRKQAVISQREAGRHTQSFARGLKASLREDPDVIVIGELRDRESVEIALTAAETGHLVLATMSTPSAAKTIDRLIDMFPPEEHSQVRASVAGALRAIVAQRLLPRRGGGIVPAIELVTGVLPLAVLIRDDKLFQLPNLLQRGRAFGMIRFDESLVEHVRAGRIDEATALAFAENKKELAVALKPPAAAGPPPSAKTSPLWGFGKKENR